MRPELAKIKSFHKKRASKDPEMVILTKINKKYHKKKGDCIATLNLAYVM